MAKKSKKPSGLSLTRSRSKFKCSWKRKDKYEKQYFQKRRKVNDKNKKWSTESIGKSATSKAFTINPQEYFPVTSTILNAISFRVKGKASKKPVSGWVRKTLSIEPPKKPSVSYSMDSPYSIVFDVEVDKFVNDRRWWGTYVEYQTALSIDTQDTEMKDVEGWYAPDREDVVNDRNRKLIYDSFERKDVLSYFPVVIETAQDRQSIEEAVSNKKDATRWFRARVCGPGGPSKWSVLSVKYTKPKATKVLESWIKDNNRGGYSCYVKYQYYDSYLFPIDTLSFQYAFAVPNEYLQPITPSGQDAVIGGNNSIIPNAKDKGTALVSEINFEIPDHEDLDHLVYVRVNSEHNGAITYGEWKWCSDSGNPNKIPNYETKLKPPSALTVTPTTGNLVQINTNNNSEVKDVFIAIKLLTEDVNDTKVIGLIDSNDQTGDLQSTIEIPPEYVDGNYEIGVFAVVDSRLRGYYTLQGTEVLTPTQDELNSYYEKVERSGSTDYYVFSEDTELKTYYTVEATVVDEPVEDALPIYYELVDGVYEQTGDETIDPSATYYTLVGTAVEIPSQAAISSYYEFIGDETYKEEEVPIYTHTEDDILFGKTYYTVTATKVAEPLTPYLYNYYNYITVPYNGETINIYKLTEDRALFSPDSRRIQVSENVGYNEYAIDSELVMRSSLYTVGGTIIQPPSDSEFSLEHIGNGNVLITWEWDRASVDSAEIAWSDYEQALISNSPPDTYSVSNSQTNKLIVRELDLGVPWYFWIRFIKNGSPSEWSAYKSTSLTSEPNIPVLSLSKNYITLNEKVTANWTYVTTDNTDQSAAIVSLCTIDEQGNATPIGEPLAEIMGSTQYVTIDPKSEKVNWQTGNTYNIIVQVRSESGLPSDGWSDPVSVTVVEPLTCYISESDLVPSATDYSPTQEYSVGDYAYKIVIDPEDETSETRVLMKCTNAISSGGEEWDESHWEEDENQQYQELHELSSDNPLNLTVVTSSDNIEMISIVIMRSIEYFIDRPDDGRHGGYQGEIVYQKVFDKNDTIAVTIDDIYEDSYLDDEAYYYLVASALDGYGQMAIASYPFQVKWDHQAVMPIASVTIDDVAKIAIGTPSGAVEGDSCDIYRMSADGIDIVVSDAEFGETYVDPYPTIGENGGYRVVYKTYNGDYIITPSGDDVDADPSFAWIDFTPEDGYIFNSISNLIDFDNNILEIKNNVDMDNSWTKDFQTTKYLGGSIQGDFNAGFERTGSLSSDIQTNDVDTIRIIKDLAVYDGLCHVRTKDGSNYLANVEVSENIPYQPYYDQFGDFTKLASYSFSITRVDPQEEDGMTLAEWLDEEPNGVTGQ